MPDFTDSDKEMLTELSKRIDSQSRYTRVLVIVCCLVVVGIVFYSLTATITTLPDLMLAKVLGNIEIIQNEWKIADKVAVKKDKKID